MLSCNNGTRDRRSAGFDACIHCLACPHVACHGKKGTLAVLGYGIQETLAAHSSIHVITLKPPVGGLRNIYILPCTSTQIYIFWCIYVPETTARRISIHIYIALHGELLLQKRASGLHCQVPGTIKL